MEVKEIKTYKPTAAIQNNSIRGLTLLRKSKALNAEVNLGKVQGFAEGISKANCSLDDVKKMYTFLVKAERDYEPMKRTTDGGLDAASAAFLAAGGTSALAWSRMILKQVGILKSYRKEITEEQINKEDELVGIKLPISKATNEELMQVTYVAMKPGVDLHGDESDLETIRLAKESFNKSLQRANMFHMVMTDSFDIIESFLSPTDMILSNNFVQKGEWLVTLQVHDLDLWKMIKDGDITGVSIGAMANVEVLED